MNPMYGVRKLSYEKPNIIGGKEDLPWFPGKGGVVMQMGWKVLRPFCLQRNLWENVKQVIKYFFETAWIKSYQSI